MKKRIISLALALMLIVPPLASAASPNLMQRDVLSAQSEGGHVTQMGEQIYFLSEGWIRSANLDGKNVQNVTEAYQAFDLMAYGDQLYYRLPNYDTEDISYDLYRYKPRTQAGKRVLKNVGDYFISEAGTLYYALEDSDTLRSMDLATSQRNAVCRLEDCTNIYSITQVQGLLLLNATYVTSAGLGYDATVVFNPRNKNVNAYSHGTMAFDFLAHGEYFYAVPPGSLDLVQYAVDVEKAEISERQTIRENVRNFVISGNYFYIIYQSPGNERITIYKRNINTGKESTYIRAFTIDDNGRNDTTYEPMGRHIWRFSLSEDGANLFGTIKK